MTLFGFRKFPTPVARPMAPFIAASVVVYYLVAKAQDAGVNSEEHRNSPKNPYAAQIAAQKGHH
ncbi:ATP synthase j chain [Ceratobasidium sp. AG-Ba]|nr:ATP synthase j chain [Ceratobasidium sp. AG-Ba]